MILLELLVCRCAVGMLGKVSLITERTPIREPPPWVACLIGDAELKHFRECTGGRPSWALADFRDGRGVASCYMGLDGQKVRVGGLDVPLMVRPICRTTEGVRSADLRNTRWEDFETGLQPVTLLSSTRPIPLLRLTARCSVHCLQRSTSEILYNPTLRRLQTRVSAPPALPTNVTNMPFVRGGLL